MKRFLTKLRDVAVSGFFILLPAYVLLIIITKAWSSLSTLGKSVAAMFGMTSILGMGGSTVFAGALLIVSWIVCGLLTHLSLVAAFNRAAEKWFSTHVPAYDTYRAMAEEKLQHKVRVLPYTAALIRRQEYWQPAYIVEHDADGNYVMFLPDVPDTSKGYVLLARQDQIRVLSSATTNQVDGSLKRMGRDC
jgi:uncharacterized membrane protein